jgi:hypothetical protein
VSLFTSLKNKFSNPFIEPIPWLVFDAVDYIKPFLFEGMDVFEYGSGASTLYWRNHGANVVSVEHDVDWYLKVRRYVRKDTRIRYYLIEPTYDGVTDIDPEEPFQYGSSGKQYEGYEFFDYASFIEKYADEYFDLVVVDGRARPSCIAHSASKVKVGGYLILDNADRDYYLTKTKEFLSDFAKTEFYGHGPLSNVLWQTNIYRRQK